MISGRMGRVREFKSGGEEGRKGGKIKFWEKDVEIVHVLLG